MCHWCVQQVADELGRYPNVEKVIWAQEEPKNNGAWFYVAPRIRTATRHYLKKVRRRMARRLAWAWRMLLLLVPSSPRVCLLPVVLSLPGVEPHLRGPCPRGCPGHRHAQGNSSTAPHGEPHASASSLFQ